jgi:hypothetical protein
MVQLKANLRLFLRPKLTLQQCEEIERAFLEVPDTLLNPSKWNLSHEQLATARR